MEKSLDFEMRMAYVAHRAVAVRALTTAAARAGGRLSLPTLDASS